MLTDTERDQLIKDTHDNTKATLERMGALEKRVTVIERITNLAIGGLAIFSIGVAALWQKFLSVLTIGT